MKYRSREDVNERNRIADKEPNAREDVKERRIISAKERKARGDVKERAKKMMQHPESQHAEIDTVSTTNIPHRLLLFYNRILHRLPLLNRFPLLHCFPLQRQNLCRLHLNQ
jgi:hypothetical protein